MWIAYTFLFPYNLASSSIGPWFVSFDVLQSAKTQSNFICFSLPNRSRSYFPALFVTLSFGTTKSSRLTSRKLILRPSQTSMTPQTWKPPPWTRVSAVLNVRQSFCSRMSLWSIPSRFTSSLQKGVLVQNVGEHSIQNLTWRTTSKQNTILNRNHQKWLSFVVQNALHVSQTDQIWRLIRATRITEEILINHRKMLARSQNSCNVQIVLRNSSIKIFSRGIAGSATARKLKTEAHPRKMRRRLSS